MGAVGGRRSRKAPRGGAVVAFVSGCRSGSTSMSDIFKGRVAVGSEGLERRQVHDPDREHERLVPSRHGLKGLRLRYHTASGTEGEALGYVTAHDALFLETSSMMPHGTSLTLEAAEESLVTERQTMAAKVTAACPVADEFGFPPGVGVRMTEGIRLLGGT